IIEGLKEIHDNQRFHGDFHPGNILFDDRDVRITDMGLSRKVGDTGKTGSVHGIEEYMAPEVLEGKPYTQAADIYSFGKIMYFVATGKQPSDNNSLELKRVKTPKCYIDLTEKCWHSNPHDRPSTFE